MVYVKGVCACSWSCTATRVCFGLIGEVGRDADIRRVGDVFNYRGGVTLRHLHYLRARECQNSAKI